MRFIYLVVFLIFNNVITFGQSNATDSLLLRLGDEKNDTARVKLLVEIGGYLQPTNIDSAFIYYEKALQISLDKNIVNYQAYCHGCVAGVYSYQSKYDKAIDSYENSLASYKELNDKYGMCYALSNMGVAYWEKGDLETCNKYYLQALAIAESRQDTVTCTKIKINIALVFDELGDKESSLKYHMEALHDLEVINDVTGILASLQNIGVAKKDQGKYDEAIVFFERALALSLEENDLYLTAMSYENLASTYEKMDDVNLALKYNSKSIEFYKKVGNDKGIAESNLNMASLAIKLQQYYESEQYGLEALAIGDDIGALDIQRKAYESLANSCGKMKHFSKAYAYQKKFMQLKDSIYTKEKSQEILELQAKFESEKKERENELLKIENKLKASEIEKHHSRAFILYISLTFLIFLFVLIYRSLQIKKKANIKLEEKNKLITKQQKELLMAFDQLKETNEALENQKEELRAQSEILAETVATKDKFFSIIAHDLRNSFNTILLLSDLIMYTYDTSSNEERKLYIKKINSSAIIAYSLLDDLLRWARSQENGIKIAKEELGLKVLVDQGIQPYMLNATTKMISVENNISKDWFITADKYTLTTVFGNIFSNAVKFTPKGGSVIMDAKLSGEFYVVHIKDSGVGMSEEAVDSLFDIAINNSTLGTNNERGTGLGLILCKEFVEKNKGEILVSSEKGQGTTFTIRLPKE